MWISKCVPPLLDKGDSLAGPFDGFSCPPPFMPVNYRTNTQLKESLLT